MHGRNWIMGCAGLSVGALLLTACNSQPAAVPLPVRSANDAAVPTAQPVSAAPSASPTPSPPSAGFSLPIGGEMPAAPATPASVPSPAPYGSDQGSSTIPVPSLQPQGSPGLSSPAKSSAGSSAEAPGHSIHLSAGIAVPQSLPTGTVMAISVDYSSNAALHPSARYLWVIKSAAGEAVNEVKLEDSGNLSAFFLQLRPEHRPFSARIEEVTPGSKRRTVISNELPLKTDY
ncbi:MAG: hypothetical protein ACR2FY_00740 [Pirellulaceae bacterium]